MNPLDHLMAKAGIEMVRYADDFAILCRSPEEATQALAMVQEWTAAVGLTLHPTKTRIVNAKKELFEFLGYRFVNGKRYPRTKSLKKLKDTIRAKTKRTFGQCLRAIIKSLNPTLRGRFEYFKHSYKTTFSAVDGWIRMRLRSILRKRLGLKGRGRGVDHHRWRKPRSFPYSTTRPRPAGSSQNQADLFSGPLSQTREASSDHVLARFFQRT